MQLQRLYRLMSIISDINYNPRSSPDRLCARFAISRRQFYKDRDTLESLGYGFHFSRGKDRLVMDAQPQWHGLFNLCLGLKALIDKDDLNAVLHGLQAMERLIAGLPPRPQKLLGQGLRQMVWEQGLQCAPAMLEELLNCIGEGRRVVLLLKEDERHFLLDPQELALKQGVLYVVSSMLPLGHELVSLLGFDCEDASRLKPGLAVGHIRKVVPTPFYAV